MATTVAQHTVATFTSPVNGTTPIDANTVRGNDNTIRSSYNDHDSDPGIHVQSSTLASRPAAGTAGRKWITADTGEYKLWYDDGTRWNEVGNDAVDISFIADGNIVKGDVLKLTGWNNGQNLPTLGPATVSGDVCFAIATEAVNNGDRSFAINTGFIEDVNTSAFSTGDILYPSNAAGPGSITSWFQNTKPTSGNYQMAAYVIRDNASNGVLFVEFTGPRIVETSSNTASTVVLRDASGDFSAGTVTVGALTSTGLVTFASLKGTGATTVTNILDEDDFASDSDTALATQQSIKAYIASQIGAFDTLAEVLANGNTSGGTNLVMSAGDTLTTDTINETTAGAGVTIDSVLLKDDVVNATDVETGTVSANDGTLAITIANSTGALTLASALADSNLATISSAGKVANSATTADSANTASAIVARDGSGNFSAGTITASLSGNVTGNLTGNADTATKLSSSRTFALTGDVTGSVTSDLTSGASIATTISELPVSKLQDGAARQLLQTDAAGTGVEWTSNVDIPGTLDVTGATNLDSTLGVTGLITASGGVSGSLTGNADTATKLSSSRTFALTGDVTGSVSSDLTSGASIATTISELPVSKLQDGSARQLLQTDAAGTGVEWTSNVDVPGTLDVTGATALDSTLTVAGDVSIADKIIHTGDTNTAIRFPAADTVTVETAGSERLRIDSSGNVGIGVTPSAWGGSFVPALQVGNAAVYSNSTVKSLSALIGNAYYDGSSYKYIDSTFAQVYAQSDGEHLWYNAPSGTAGNTISFTERMRIDSSGNVGIGTSSPTFAIGTGLQVKGSGFTSIRVSAGSSTGLDLSQDTGGNGYLYLRDNDALIFGTNDTERMRITSGGSVGIGTTSPQTRLQVTNSIGTLENKLHTGTFGALNNGQTLVFTLDQAGTYGIELTVVCSNSSTGATAFMQTLHKYVISTAFFLSSANQTIWANGVTAATVAYGGAANTVKISVANSSGTNYDGGAAPFSNTWSLRVFSTANPSVSVSIV